MFSNTSSISSTYNYITINIYTNVYTCMYTHLFKIIFAKVAVKHQSISQSKLYLKLSSKTITFVILQYFILIRKRPIFILNTHPCCLKSIKYTLYNYIIACTNQIYK